MSMVKLAGITPDGAAKALAVNENGELKVNHIWETEQTVVMNEQIRSTSAVTSTAIEIGKYALTSLRIKNTLNKEVDVMVYLDNSVSDTIYLYNAEGAPVKITMPNNGHDMILTSDDYPFLNYLQYLHLRAQCSEAPTSGALKITVVGRR